jgi:gliding motility-associated-like protein
MPGTYNAILIVTNTNGCPDTASYSFIIEENVVAVPTAFTPNGDGINDILYVRGGPLKEIDWRIYNEWGNEMFHATTPDEAQKTGWDGTYKGKVQPAQRFVYTLKYLTVEGKAGNISGDVTITK